MLLTYSVALPYSLRRLDRPNHVQRRRRSHEDALVVQEVVDHRDRFRVGDLVNEQTSPMSSSNTQPARATIEAATVVVFVAVNIFVLAW